MVTRLTARRLICLWMCTVAIGLFAFNLIVPPLEPSFANGQTRPVPGLFELLGKQFNTLRAQYQDMTYPELRSRLEPEPNYLEALPFNPTQARYFEIVQHRLELTEQERALFVQNGFVTIDQGRSLSFPAAYQQIYTSDLPVFISSDSILHALHRSYDEILKELETSYFRSTLGEILADCQTALAKRAADSLPQLRDNLRDADLYLGVARKLLLALPKSPQVEFIGGVQRPILPTAIANDMPKPVQYSVLGREAAIDTVMADIDSLRMQTPKNGCVTKIYGGKRYVDYSQFRPRGHYTESAELAAYFRCLMWLGRADCGWIVCPTDQTSGNHSQSQRELCNAALLTELLRDSGGTTRLHELDQALKFLVGRSDNFGVFQLSELLQASHIRSVRELIDADVASQLQQVIAADPHGAQLIRSQTLVPIGGAEPTPTPIIFQLFGQRFVIDSFVLSKVVHDEIIYQGYKVERHHPTALDVMAALGNDEAIGLLSAELERWEYSANLMACRELVQQLDDDFWTESLHHAWLDGLQSLDADMTVEPHAPSALRTRAWQRKQLQTQLASWAELRRDNILYAKQSYGVPGCAFPCGYVEPYPEFYSKLRRMADTAGRMLGKLSPISQDAKPRNRLEQNRARQVAFFQEMSVTMRMLEQIARDELHGQPLSESQREFLRGTFDDSGKLKFGSAQLTDFSGWYCRLFYGRLQDPVNWSPRASKPVVADVHSNPDSEDVLEVATGDARLLVIAIEGATNPTVYVGPVSSYYEFWQPAVQRLNDQEWRQRLASQPPPRPSWTTVFEAEMVRRTPENPRVTTRRNVGSFSVMIEDSNVSSYDMMSVSAATVRHLAESRNLHSLDLSDSKIGDEALLPLAGLSDLRSLDLSGTKITDAGVAFLKEQRHLQFLDLSATAITDSVVPSLSGLVHLSQLDLRDTQVTEAAVRELRLQLQYTEVLH